MNGFTLAWIIWGVVTLGSFAIIEYMAFKEDLYDTLSENLQRLFGKLRVMAWVTLGLWGLFTMWFAVHIWGDLL